MNKNRAERRRAEREKARKANEHGVEAEPVPETEQVGDAALNFAGQAITQKDLVVVLVMRSLPNDRSEWAMNWGMGEEVSEGTQAMAASVMRGVQHYLAESKEPENESRIIRP